MAAGRYSFTLEQGATFTRQVQYLDGSGLPVDLTNYAARMQIRPTVGSTTVLVNLTTTVGADGSGIIITAPSGTLDITISATSSSMLSFNEAVFDLEIYSGSGVSVYVKRLLEGGVKMSKEVTR